jgi:hypothetical protein
MYASKLVQTTRFWNNLHQIRPYQKIGKLRSQRDTINKYVGWYMALNAPFNNMSVIFWRSSLSVEEIGVHGENHQPVGSH